MNDAPLSTLQGFSISLGGAAVPMAAQPVLMAGILPTGNPGAMGLTPAVAASAVLTSNNTNVSNNDPVVVDGVTYTYKTTLTAATTAFEVLIGADADASLLNLSKAVNRNGAAGTDYGSETPLHPRAGASLSVTAHALTFTAKAAGSAGNGIKVSTTAATLSWSASTLQGGDDPKLNVATAADLITVVPVCDTSAYTAGDVLFDTTAIPNAVRTSGGQAVLQTLTVIDKDDQAAADMVIYIFDTGSSLTFGTANAAPSISDANAAKLVGVVSIASADWKDLGGAKVANVRGLGIVCESSNGRELGFAATTGGTPTQTASGLVFRFGFLW